MEKDKALADTALTLFANAQAKADADSAYGKRIALIDDFLKGLRMKTKQLGQKSGVLFPRYVCSATQPAIVIDGKLDDAYWRKCAVASQGKLYELQTGRTPYLWNDVQIRVAGQQCLLRDSL